MVGVAELPFEKTLVLTSCLGNHRFDIRQRFFCGRHRDFRRLDVGNLFFRYYEFGGHAQSLRARRHLGNFSAGSSGRRNV